MATADSNTKIKPEEELREINKTLGKMGTLHDMLVNLINLHREMGGDEIDNAIITLHSSTLTDVATAIDVYKIAIGYHAGRIATVPARGAQ